MKKPVLWALAAIMIVAILLYAAGGGRTDPESVLNFQGPHMVALIALLVVFLAGMLARRPAMGEVMRAVLFWGGLGIVLVALYAFRGELETVGRRTTAVLVPGMTVSEGGGSDAIMVARGGDSHFHVTAKVDGASIRFLVDTGASAIVLSRQDARAAGIDVDRLAYSIPVSTANGTAMVAPVRLGRISVGGISRANMPAFVAARGALRTSLLGMTFLNALSSWEMRGDRLILRP